MDNLHRGLVALYALATLYADGRAFERGAEAKLLAALLQYGRELIVVFTIVGVAYVSTVLVTSLRTVTAAGPVGRAYLVESRGRPNKRRRFRTAYPLDHLCLVEAARYKPIVPAAAALAWLALAAVFAMAHPAAALLPMIAGAIHVWILLRVITAVVTSAPRADVYVGRAGSGDVFLAGASFERHAALTVNTWFTERRLVVRGERFTRVERVRRPRLGWFLIAAAVGFLTWAAERSVPLAVAAALPVLAVAIALMFRFQTVAQFTSGTSWAVPGDHLEALGVLLTQATLQRDAAAAERRPEEVVELVHVKVARPAAAPEPAAAPTPAAAPEPAAALAREAAAPSLRPSRRRPALILAGVGVLAVGAAVGVPALKKRASDDKAVADRAEARFQAASHSVSMEDPLPARDEGRMGKRESERLRPAPPAVPAPAMVPAPAPAGRCDHDGLGCAYGQTGRLTELIGEARAAREAGRAKEALCLLYGAMPDADGASIEAARAREEALAWDAHGCRARAQETLCASLQTPRDGRTGWRDSCVACRQLEAACCAPCGDALPAVAQSPEQLLAMQREALAEHDAAAFAATCAPGLLRVGASAGDTDGEREAGLADLTRDLERMRKKGSTSHVLASWTHVSQVSEDQRVAWMVVDFEWTWVTDGKEKTLRWVLSQVAERQDDGWRVVAAHWSRPMSDRAALARAKDGKQPPAETWPPPTGGEGAAAAEDARVAFRDALGEAPLAPLFGGREDAVAVGSAEDEHWTGRAVAKAWTGIEARVAVEGEPAAWPVAGGQGVYVAANLLLFQKGETPVAPAPVDEGAAPVDAGPPGATPRRYRLTALLVREGDGWQLVLLHASSAR